MTDQRPKTISRGARTRKYQAIVDDVIRGIRSGEIGSGQLLPSQVELIERYGVALGTVRRAIDRLQAKGWVRPEPGRGLFAAVPSSRGSEQRADRSQTLGFAVLGSFAEYNPINQMVLHGALSVLQPVGRDLIYGVFDPADSSFESRFDQFLDRVRGVLVFQRIDPRSVEMIRVHGVKAVLVGHGYAASAAPVMQEFSQVDNDIENAGYLAANALASAGHTSLAFMHEFESEFFELIHRGFQRACADHHVHGEHIRVKPSRQTEVEAARALAQETTFTGIIAVGDIFACKLIADLRDRGTSVPEDRSVISIGGLPRDMLSEPRLTRVNTNMDALGARAAQALLADGGAVIHQLVPVTFEKGATLQPRFAMASAGSETLAPRSSAAVATANGG